MLRKKFFCWIVYCFFFIEKAFAAEEGMPQLNPEYWISQIFWLTIIFFILYFILSKLILPKISEVLESRKSTILTNLEEAEKFKKDSEVNLKKYETILKDAKNQSNLIISNARKQLNEDIKNKKDQLEAELEIEIVKVENEIKTFKKNSLSNVNKIAIEISSSLIKDIVDVEVNKSNVSAIVEDISKKTNKKYI